VSCSDSEEGCDLVPDERAGHEAKEKDERHLAGSGALLVAMYGVSASLDRKSRPVLTLSRNHPTIRRMGSKRIPASKRRSMARMRERGLQDVEIANHFHISKQRVGQLLGAKVPRGPRKKPNGQAAGG
jgi:hypothetical protein